MMTDQETCIWTMLRSMDDHVYISLDRTTLYIALEEGLLKLTNPYGRPDFTGMSDKEINEFIIDALKEMIEPV